MKTLSIPLPGVVVASMCLAAPWALASLGQGRESVPMIAAPVPGREAIRPQNIVNLYESGAIVPTGPGLTLYTVPGDRWLVVRDCELFWSFGGIPTLVEDLGGTETVKRDPTLGNVIYSSLGLAFQPGSDVVLKTSSGSDQTVSYSINGYLAAP